MKIQDIKIGKPVNYYSTCNEDGSFEGRTPKKTFIASEAWKLGHGAHVCKVEGVRGGVSLTHLEDIQKDRHSFFTDEFYFSPESVLNMINEIHSKNLIADRDTYQDGTTLFMELYDKDETRKILSKVISDLDAYIAFNNEHFFVSDPSQIYLNALIDEHNSWYHISKEIRWTDEDDSYVFLEIIETIND